MMLHKGQTHLPLEILHSELLWKYLLHQEAEKKNAGFISSFYK